MTFMRAAVMLGCLWLAGPALAFSAKGNDNPVISYNAAGAGDSSAAMQFLDIAKSMRAWIGHIPPGWGGMKYEELVAEGYIDTEGWLRAIPERVSYVGTTWQWAKQPEAADQRKGIYVMTYDGQGDVRLSGDARVLEQAPGRIRFRNRAGRNMFLEIHETDPNGTGEYIRNIKIIAERHQALYDAGARFNPDWIDYIADARQMRFMIWERINNAPPKTWATRATPAGLFSRRGVPIEYQVKLANEIGADPWFNIPHRADESYIRGMATYVRDHLDPALEARVEYSNETWNWSFQQTHWLDKQSRENWGRADHHSYHSKKAVEAALIWDDVFGAQADTRLIHVMGSQAGNAWGTGKRLVARGWKRAERSAYVPPTEVFDEIAITNYFGGASMRNAELRAQLVAAIKDPNIDAAQFLARNLTAPGYTGSIPAKAVFWKEQADLAAKHGMGLVAYEGGQHVHHSFAVKKMDKADLTLLTDFMRDFVRSREMANLYRASWEAWAEVSAGPYMQFVAFGRISKWGSWGMRTHIGDDTPRARLLDRLGETSRPWWSSRPGPQYQHGVVQRASDGPARLRGTLQEDYLLGGPEDDILSPGPGNDGVHGGAGFDRVRLSGSAQMYRLRRDGIGYEITGPDGRDRLVEIEMLEFDAGQSIALADIAGLATGPDGQIALPQN